MRFFTLSRVLLAAVTLVVEAGAASPRATTKNGTYEGAYLPTWDQDVFLGMPYAQPPVGSLRFKWPVSINSSFDGVRNATSYGYSCLQYGTNLSLSEDCLTINVVRPSTASSDNTTKPLPVLVWVYGGGLSLGSTADPQYNLSGIVKVSQEMGRPMIAVSMNYRLGMWGFFQSAALLAEGSSNAGLIDQRLALRWVQENIGAFGGDPKRVTVWGESAGAQSIAYQMFAYRGRDDRLFRAAIMESGGPTGCQVEPLSWYNTAVENVTRAVGCFGVKDQLDCLRGVSQAKLYEAHPTVVWNPLLDGDFLQAYPSQQMLSGEYVKVPAIVGANTDEGFAITGIAGSRTPIDTEQDILTNALTWRSYSLTPPTIKKLLQLYPDDPCTQPPYAIYNCTLHPSRGKMWRRAYQIGADLVMQAGRRKMAELLTAAGTAVYSYRFDQRPWAGNMGADEWDGVRHFVNVAYSMQNVSGLLGPEAQFQAHRELARGIGQAYVNFVHDMDPNEKKCQSKGSTDFPLWPIYDLDNPENIVFNASQSRVEKDDWRKEGIAYINTPEVTKEMLG